VLLGTPGYALAIYFNEWNKENKEKIRSDRDTEES